MLCSRRWMSQRRIEVIVTDSLPGLGEKGEVVKVRPGHARNHLFPKKMAVYATDVNRIKFEEWTMALKSVEREEEIKRAQAVARIETVVVKTKRQVVGTHNDGAKKLHAPIRKADIVRHLWRQHYIHVPPDRVDLDDDKGLASLGEHTVTVRVGDSDARAKLRVLLEAR